MTTTASTVLHLDPSGAPLYQQVMRAMLGALAANEWKQGEALPSEKLLAERFGVSIGTLRKAIDELTAENILIRHQGRGTFVARHTRDSHFFKFFRIVRQDGKRTFPKSELIRFRRIKADEEAREKLLLGPNDWVYEFLNLQRLYDQKVLVDTINLPVRLFSGMDEDILLHRPSTLYSLYQEMFGINVIGTIERVRVGSADAEHAGLLGVQEGFALLEVRRVAYSFENKPVEWRISRINTSKYEYTGQGNTMFEGLRTGES